MYDRIEKVEVGYSVAIGFTDGLRGMMIGILLAQGEIYSEKYGKEWFWKIALGNQVVVALESEVGWVLKWNEEMLKGKE